MADRTREDRVRTLGEMIAGHLDMIQNLYRDPVYVTLVVRAHETLDGSRDTMLSTDTDPEKVIAAYRRLLADPASECYDVGSNRKPPLDG